jgi:hypothetical protein
MPCSATAWHLMWNLRHGRFIVALDRIQSTSGIHNQWLKVINAALTRDCLLTDRIKFGPLAHKKQLVLNTWIGLLIDEESLPENWTHEGVLVGIRPITDRHGIGCPLTLGSGSCGALIQLRQIWDIWSCLATQEVVVSILVAVVF